MVNDNDITEALDAMILSDEDSEKSIDGIPSKEFPDLEGLTKAVEGLTSVQSMPEVRLEPSPHMLVTLPGVTSQSPIGGDVSLGEIPQSKVAALPSIPPIPSPSMMGGDVSLPSWPSAESAAPQHGSVFTSIVDLLHQIKGHLEKTTGGMWGPSASTLNRIGGDVSRIEWSAEDTEVGDYGISELYK